MRTQQTTKSRLSGKNEWVKATSNENRFCPIASSHVRFPRGRRIFVPSFSCSLFPESFGRPKFGPLAIPKKLERCRPNSSDGVVVVSDSSTHRQQLPGEFGVQFLLLVLRLFIIIIIIIISFLLSAEFEQTHQLYCSPGHSLWSEEDELGGRA